MFDTLVGSVSLEMCNEIDSLGAEKWNPGLGLVLTCSYVPAPALDATMSRNRAPSHQHMDRYENPSPRPEEGLEGGCASYSAMAPVMRAASEAPKYAAVAF